jgi:hypothetical protein
MLSIELVQKHIRAVAQNPDSKHWFPVYAAADPLRSFRARVEEQHWTARSVNERMNNLTREVLELLASDPEMAERISAAEGVFVFSDEETIFAGFRNGGGGQGQGALVLNLSALVDEMDRQPRSPAKWCVVS